MVSCEAWCSSQKLVTIAESARHLPAVDTGATELPGLSGLQHFKVSADTPTLPSAPPTRGGRRGRNGRGGPLQEIRVLPAFPPKGELEARVLDNPLKLVLVCLNPVKDAFPIG